MATGQDGGLSTRPTAAIAAEASYAQTEGVSQGPTPRLPGKVTQPLTIPKTLPDGPCQNHNNSVLNGVAYPSRAQRCVSEGGFEPP